jgi:acetyl esterase/lipase
MCYLMLIRSLALTRPHLLDHTHSATPTWSHPPTTCLRYNVAKSAHPSEVILRWVRENRGGRPTRIVVCGHSLGGGYSKLLAIDLINKGHPVELLRCVTFGAPMVLCAPDDPDGRPEWGHLQTIVSQCVIPPPPPPPPHTHSLVPPTRCAHAPDAHLTTPSLVFARPYVHPPDHTYLTTPS